MVYPPSGVAAPPQAQLDSRATLSGTEVAAHLDDTDATNRYPSDTMVPVEWTVADEDEYGTYKRLIPGYMWPDELDAYLANPPPPAEEPPPDEEPPAEEPADPPPTPTLDPLAARVAAFVGLPDDPAVLALASVHVPVVTDLARAYTRDRGFVGSEPEPGIAAVIVTATARMLANPDQLAHDVGSTSVRGGFTGWSLAETFALNRYRRRAQ